MYITGYTPSIYTILPLAYTPGRRDQRCSLSVLEDTGDIFSTKVPKLRKLDSYPSPLDSQSDTLTAEPPLPAITKQHTVENYTDDNTILLLKVMHALLSGISISNTGYSETHHINPYIVIAYNTEVKFPFTTCLFMWDVER